jgi:predicted secreted hydrolase
MREPLVGQGGASSKPLAMWFETSTYDRTQIQTGIGHFGIGRFHHHMKLCILMKF